MYQHDGTIKLKNDTGASIFIARPEIKYGKFFNAPDKDKEILPCDIDGTEIKDKEAFLIHVCGRDMELSGTEGTIDLEDMDDNLITTLYWDVPIRGSTNTFSVAGMHSKYIVVADGYSRTGTGLGTAEVEITKKPTTAS